LIQQIINLPYEKEIIGGRTKNDIVTYNREKTEGRCDDGAEMQIRIENIYIDRDWSVIWNTNEKVLAQFDWTFFSKKIRLRSI